MIARTLALGVAAATLLSTGALAADLYSGRPATDLYSSPMFNFDGAYVGAQGGGYWGTVNGPSVTGWNLDVVAGVNFAMTDLILAGLEFQGGVMWPDSGWKWDMLGLARVGAEFTDGVMAYGAAGVGSVAGNGVYAFGGGVEVATFSSVSVRGEILGLANWGQSPSAAKATAGVLFHFN